MGRNSVCKFIDLLFFLSFLLSFALLLRRRFHRILFVCVCVWSVQTQKQRERQGWAGGVCVRKIVQISMTIHMHSDVEQIIHDLQQKKH